MPHTDRPRLRRVVFNGRVFAQPRSGVQRYGEQTLRAIDRLLGRQPALRDAAEWELALPHDATDVPLLENFAFRVPPLLRGHAWEQVELAGLARGAFLVNFGYSGPLAKRDQLITVHDVGPSAQPDSYTPAYRAWHALVLRALAPRVHTLMTVSRFSARQLAAELGLDRNVVVARPGCDHAAPASEAQADAVLRRFGLSPRGYLLAVGSPKPSKNFALVPQALALLGHGHAAAGLPLVVAGAVDTRVHPDARAAGADTHADGTRFVGAVDELTLTALYRHAAWFVFPSRYEGFGLPPLEAMAQGCPVIASNAASIPEVCGDAALYFDPSDPASLAARIAEATHGDGAAALRETMVRLGRERAAAYRWDRNAELIVARLVEAGAVSTLAGGSMATPRLAPLQ